ncbi:50S ribosomal protein L24, partial [Frankia casuarinae]
MATLKIKKGDTVQIITGKDRGLKGKVIRAYPEQNKVLVEGANRITRHTRVQQGTRGSQSGGIIT